ncbi:exocyst complex component EXO70B1 [Elaeis guineensis]|uniref:Exocyst subunit Exo70 family protein n=1 Tax=Elaeis guineensis var. tenera TaxID=51953 RepID=A0A6I9RAL6_ELAGV|nr:exocyst complex component EXO70B1 [Elaeis guineensis]
MASENGEDKLLAAVRHIAKTLGRTETMADDILQIFSTFDGRLSREKLSEKQHDDGSLGDGGGGGVAAGDDRLSLSSMNRTLRYLDHQISRFVTSDRLIWSDSADASAFLEAVDDLLDTIHDLDPPAPGNKPLLDRADDLLQKCMLRLEDEFRSLIERSDGGSPLDAPAAGSSPFDSDGENSDGDDGQVPVAHPVKDYDLIIDALPPGTVSDLHEIARRMVVAGFGRECAEVYALAHRDFVEESVARLGIRHRTAEEVQGTPWADLDDEIARWLKAINMVFRILIPSERRLCDRIFAGLSPFADLAFAAVSRASAIQLLSFADAVAIGNRAPERLFRVVDMYEAVRDLFPDLDPLFSDQYSTFLRTEAATLSKSLAAAIRGIFMELENLIRRDPARAAVPGGGLHPITRYVMNYLRAACASRRTLEEVMEEDTGTASPPDPDRPSSSLAVQIAWIMDVLQGNLEVKSKIYREPSLSCIFLMNNGRYIIQKVRDSELSVLLGEEWIRRQMARVRRWGNEYQRATWSKVIAVLRTDGATGSASVAAKAMRERLQVFNSYFDEIYRSQTGWVLADEQLKAELRISVSELVLPAYRNFLARYRNAADSGKYAEKHARYSEEDVEARIGELFEGTGKRS